MNFKGSILIIGTSCLLIVEVVFLAVESSFSNEITSRLPVYSTDVLVHLIEGPSAPVFFVSEGLTFCLGFFFEIGSRKHVSASRDMNLCQMMYLVGCKLIDELDLIFAHVVPDRQAW